MLQTCMFRSTSPPGHCDEAGSGYHSFPENGNRYSADTAKDTLLTPRPGTRLPPCVLLPPFGPSTYPNEYASVFHSCQPYWGEARPACASRKNIFLLCDTHRPQKHWRIKIFSPPCRAQYFLTPRCEPAIPVPCKAQRSNERRQ